MEPDRYTHVMSRSVWVLKRLWFPAAPGIVCAQGLVVSDIKEDFVASQRITVSPQTHTLLREQIEGLLTQTTGWFEHENIAPGLRGLELSLDARYVGQNFELSVPVASGASINPEALPDYAGLREHFFAVHEQAYGYFNPDDPIEIINFRVTARGRLYRGDETLVDSAQTATLSSTGERDIYFAPEQATPSKVYERTALGEGHRINGPAVIEQLDTTTLIYPGDHAVVDALGNILIHISGA